jgi:hypothetical protein
MENNDNQTPTMINQDLTYADIDLHQPTDSESSSEPRNRKQLPDLVWDQAKIRFANETTLTLMDIKDQIGAGYQTVVYHAKRDGWWKAREEATKRKVLAEAERFRLGTLRGVGSVENEAKAIANYLEGLENGIRKALVVLGAVTPISPQEETMAMDADSKWHEMSIREAAQCLKWMGDVWRELSQHKQLLVGKPTNRLEVSGPPATFSVDEETMLERMLNRTVNPGAVREELDMEQGEDGRFKAEAEMEKTMPLDAENDS